MCWQSNHLLHVQGLCKTRACVMKAMQTDIPVACYAHVSLKGSLAFTAVSCFCLEWHSHEGYIKSKCCANTIFPETPILIEADILQWRTLPCYAENPFFAVLAHCRIVCSKAAFNVCAACKIGSPVCCSSLMSSG